MDLCSRLEGSKGLHRVCKASVQITATANFLSSSGMLQISFRIIKSTFSTVRGESYFLGTRDCIDNYSSEQVELLTHPTARITCFNMRPWREFIEPACAIFAALGQTWPDEPLLTCCCNLVWNMLPLEKCAQSRSKFGNCGYNFYNEIVPPSFGNS